MPRTMASPPEAFPQWRGFNLSDLMGYAPRVRYQELDFAWTAEWGFNFVRLPVSFLNWSEPDRWDVIQDSGFTAVGQGIEFARRYGLHASLALHSVPGYSVSHRTEDTLFHGSLQQQRIALDALKRHWRHIAERYRDLPADALSFGLLNEPPFLTDTSRYEAICREVVAEIRAVSPDRVIFADGIDLGQTPVPGVADLHIAQSTRGYLPKALSHFGAEWIAAAEFESDSMPGWPMIDSDGKLWDRERLQRTTIAPWLRLAQQGVPIHVGEWGAHNRTPHHVVLAWMRDQLALWQQAGWGWALWNLRGSFGVIDSGRRDVVYERFRGHLLDRRMLELLRLS